MAYFQPSNDSLYYRMIRTFAELAVYVLNTNNVSASVLAPSGLEVYLAAQLPVCRIAILVWNDIVVSMGSQDNNSCQIVQPADSQTDLLSCLSGPCWRYFVRSDQH